MSTFVKLFCTVFLIIGSESIFAKGFADELCKDTQEFNCYIAKKGDTWDKLFPRTEQQDIVMRVNRVGIKLYPGMKIAIPNNLDSATSLSFSPFATQIAAPGEKTIMVNLKTLAWGAYDAQGTLQKWGPVSGGRGYCPDTKHACKTPTGKFAIYQKGGGACKSTKFPIGKGGAPMPYCMFFKGGFALHGSYEVVGYNASHGCSRMIVKDAQWLNQEFVQDTKSVPVIISNE